MDKLYKKLPHFAQELMVTAYNILAYRKRYGGKYRHFLKVSFNNRNLSRAQLEKIQRERYFAFVGKAVGKSAFYKKLYQDIPDAANLDNIRKLPVIGKETLRENIEDVYTISKSEANIGKTGGTTGKSLEVRYTHENTQERFAMLDDFRGRFGYKLGKRTAWFSGKALLTNGDISKRRFWKTDHYHNVRYYSTYHINDKYLEAYVRDIVKYKPEYLVGYPSAMAEVAKFGLSHNIPFPKGIVKAVFTTSETIIEEVRRPIETWFHTSLYDQYASSEGAPFIFECKNHKFHVELQSGVFEVLDENDNPAQMGRLVLTSFTTEGTPLIRYDIGDSLELTDETCDCGNNNPLTKQILGRISDYVYSPETGKLHLANVSNTLKDTRGIVRFQVLQDELDAIVIKLVVDRNEYTPAIEAKFLANWRDRVGDAMKINLEFTDDIPVEKSGKYRIVKNNIRHLLE